MEVDLDASLKAEVKDLEQRLASAKAKLTCQPLRPKEANIVVPVVQEPALHDMMLLCDSAFPLGAFAFSSGLESCLAHGKQDSAQTRTSLNQFVTLSVESISSTTGPFLIAGYRDPDHLFNFDNDLDASITCAVARRASITQGRALLSIWERSFRNHGRQSANGRIAAARATLDDFLQSTKTTSTANQHNHPHDTFPIATNGHLPPLLGTVCLIMGLSMEQTIYMYILNHCKALLSAAIRAGLIGPYQSQSLLASQWIRDLITINSDHMLRSPVKIEDAGQTAPLLDLWGGRHELVYSRIFNS